MFCPGSQISDKPLKDISHLINEPQKFALIKLDKIRGNACVSRRQIVSLNKKEDKAKVIEKYKVGDVIKNAVVKGYTNFGVFFDVNNGELDCLVHLQEISYSRVNHPDEIFNVGEKHDLLVITVDKEKLQVGCSIKQLSPDPFDHISNYDLNKPYKVSKWKLIEFDLVFNKARCNGASPVFFEINLSNVKSKYSLKASCNWALIFKLSFLILFSLAMGIFTYLSSSQILAVRQGIGV